MRFTNSPYEKMMQEIPRYERPKPTEARVGSPCHGCPYWQGIACMSCYRKLLPGKKDRRQRLVP